MEHRELAALEDVLSCVALLEQSAQIAAIRARFRHEPEILAEVEFMLGEISRLRLWLIDLRWRERPATRERMRDREIERMTERELNKMGGDGRRV